jgi:hypothetical protein
MRKDFSELSFLYENVLINEISQKYVDVIKKAANDHVLPFENVFNNKLRIILPIKGTETYNAILNDISKIKDFDRFDPEKKEVVRKIKLDPKYGGGEKEQKINLGRAINSLKIDPETKKKYLNWFANYESNIPEMNDLKRFSVVVSRSPIDVLRMSDISDIESCHSQGGAYFQCAIQEAITGGAVAYVVHTRDLKKLSDDEFQNEEIFEDKERNVKGIGVWSRLRIRRYEIEENNNDIGIPEVKIYGRKIPGFYDTVKNFLTKSQQYSVDNLYKLYKNKQLKKTGGSYSDSSDSQLFNRMYDTDVFYGSIRHEDNDENAGREAQFEEELAGFQNRFEFEHCNAGYSIDGDDDYVYYTAWGAINIDLGEYQVIDDFVEFDSEYEISQLKKYNKDSQHQWERSLPYNFKNRTQESSINTYKNFLTDFEQYDSTSFVEDSLASISIKRNYNEETGNWEKNHSSMSLGILFNNEESTDDTDEYLSFLREVDNIDGNYESIKKALLKALLKNGLIKSGPDMEKYTTISKEEEFVEDIKNFEFDTSEDALTTDIFLGRYTELSKDVAYANISMIFGEALEKYLDTYYKSPQINTQQTTFDKFFENHYNETLVNKYGIENIKCRYTTQAFNAELYNMSLEIKFEALNSKTAPIIKFLNDHYDDITNIAKMFFLKLAKIENQDTKRLQQVYGKLLQ